MNLIIQYDLWNKKKITSCKKILISKIKFILNENKLLIKKKTYKCNSFHSLQKFILTQNIFFFFFCKNEFTSVLNKKSFL